MKKLFKKYTQVGADPEKSKLGYGLGLWYTKYLLGKLNGKIDFRSTKDVGTWVKIEIPCKIASYKPIKTLIGPSSLHQHLDQDPCIFIRNNDNLETLIITEYLKKISIHNHLDIIQTRSLEEVLNSEKLQGNKSVLILEEKSITPSEIEALRNFKLSPEGRRLFTILLKDSTARPREIPQEHTETIESESVIKKPIKYVQMEQIAKNIETTLGQNLFKESFSSQSDDQPRVLLVDDEGIALTLLQRYFHKNGIQCLTAKDGLEAVEIYKKEAKNIKVIVIDSQMPRMGGIEATKTIRALGNNKGLQIIGLSGDASEEFKQEAIRNGMNQVFVKPAPLNTLLQGVAEALDMKRY